MISYFGCVLPDDKINDWKGTSEAANRFQKRFLESFKGEINSIHSVVSCNSRSDSIVVDNIGKISLIKKPQSLFGPISVFVKYCFRVIKACKSKTIIIQFNPEYYSILTPLFSKLYKVDSVLILSDFTESVEYSNLLKKLFSIILKRTINKYTKIVVLSDTNLVHGHKHILKYRGAVNETEYSDFNQHTSHDKINILYSGYFDNHTGINLLLNAFFRIEQNNLELHFSGWGPLEDTINTFAADDSRIINHGFVDRDHFLDLMRKAHILVNPRDMSFPQNQNNFPSKVLEYLASGRVVISTEFSGYKDFDKYKILFANSDDTSIQLSILKAIDYIEDLSVNSFEINRINIKDFYIGNLKMKIRDFVFSD